MAKRQRLCILGATGSVGMNTLEVLALHPQRFEVFALTARHRIDELAALCERWRPRLAVVDNAQQARILRERLGRADVHTEVLHGAAALSELAAHPEIDTVMAAIVGAAGLAPCLAAARAGKRLLLANKEALVVGGGLFMRSVDEGGATLLPIDSEHSAIFQCLPLDRAGWAERIDHIVLTASGGPFRERDPLSLRARDTGRSVRTSQLGDGAQDLGRFGDDDEQGARGDRGTLAVRAAARADSRGDPSAEHRSFDGRLPRPVGPGATRHARHASADCLRPGLARTIGFRSFAAATSRPWVRRPSRRWTHGAFRASGSAYDCLKAAPGATNVLNAANEIAVATFLEGAIRFPTIHAINAATLEQVAGHFGPQDTLDDLLALDERARAVAQRHVKARTT